MGTRRQRQGVCDLLRSRWDGCGTREPSTLSPSLAHSFTHAAILQEVPGLVQEWCKEGTVPGLV